MDPRDEQLDENNIGFKHGVQASIKDDEISVGVVFRRVKVSKAVA